MSGPYKICSETAEIIKELISDSLRNRGRVSPEVAKQSREIAKNDFINHLLIGDYEMGGGTANCKDYHPELYERKSELLDTLLLGRKDNPAGQERLG